MPDGGDDALAGERGSQAAGAPGEERPQMLIGIVLAQEHGRRRLAMLHPGHGPPHRVAVQIIESNVEQHRIRVMLQSKPHGVESGI